MNQAIQAPKRRPNEHHHDPASTLASRQLFWNNVMREILTSLSIESMKMHGQPIPANSVFDGRLAILTRSHERIAIAEVHPLFACSINTSADAIALSQAVESTVFQIKTPAGEVFTLPLAEMRGFHALTPELMAQLADHARRSRAEGSGEEVAEPFGFAAFTSMAREGGEPASSQ